MWGFTFMEDIKRFIKYLKITETGCWEWQGAIDKKDGYGYFTLGKLEYAHRSSYKLFKGEIEKGLQIDHLCRNRPCVNPDHLEPVTPKENTMRSPIAPASVNAKKTQCNRGHEYTSMTMKIIKSTGERRCRVCERINKANFRRKRKALGLPYM